MTVRQTFVLRDGKLVDKATAEPLHSPGPAFHYISDVIDATRHMADGNYYDSKSKFRQVTRAHGCIEIGNEPLVNKPRPQLDRRQRAMDIKHAIEQLRSR